MAKGKRKPQKARPLRVDAAERALATPETMRKLTGCPLRRMHAAGQLTDAQRDAALEIALVLDAIGGRLRNVTLGDRGNGELSDKIAEVHAQRYVPWTRQVRGDAMIVHDLTVGSMIPEEIVMHRRLRLADVIERAQHALDCYAAIQRRTPHLDIRALVL